MDAGTVIDSDTGITFDGLLVSCPEPHCGAQVTTDKPATLTHCKDGSHVFAAVEPAVRHPGYHLP